MISYRPAGLIHCRTNERELAVMRTLLTVLEDAIADDDMEGAADVAEQLAAHARHVRSSEPPLNRPEEAM
jgi:hypothetical protein